MQLVWIPCLYFRPGATNTGARTRKRGDAPYFFEWLRKKRNVKRIIHVSVESPPRPNWPSYDDELIDGALKGFQIEVLDWGKADLSLEVIRSVGCKLREVRLYWSGSSAVFRGWSTPEGLVSSEIGNLTTVHLSPMPVSTKPEQQLFYP